jgi:hypothetical protein
VATIVDFLFHYGFHAHVLAMEQPCAVGWMVPLGKNWHVLCPGLASTWAPGLASTWVKRKRRHPSTRSGIDLGWWGQRPCLWQALGLQVVWQQCAAVSAVGWMSKGSRYLVSRRGAAVTWSLAAWGVDGWCHQCTLELFCFTP